MTIQKSSPSKEMYIFRLSSCMYMHEERSVIMVETHALSRLTEVHPLERMQSVLALVRESYVSTVQDNIKSYKARTSPKLPEAVILQQMLWCWVP